MAKAILSYKEKDSILLGYMKAIYPRSYVRAMFGLSEDLDIPVSLTVLMGRVQKNIDECLSELG